MGQSEAFPPLRLLAWLLTLQAQPSITADFKGIRRPRCKEGPPDMCDGVP